MNYLEKKSGCLVRPGSSSWRHSGYYRAHRSPISFRSGAQPGAATNLRAFAVSDAHAAALGAPEPLSTEHLYFHGIQRTPNGHPNLGVSLPTILDALNHDGQCVETGWPYLDALPMDLAKWTPPSTATPAYRRNSSRA